MKRRLVAAAVALAVLFGASVRPQAGTVADEGAASSRTDLDGSSNNMQLHAAGKELVGEDFAGKAVSVSLGLNHAGVMTEDGSLYMWGSNSWGQLGDGTKENRYIPVKVLENVQTVSLYGDEDNSAAVTKDGSLYIWGRDFDNFQEQKDYDVPVKVQENIQTVSIGGFCACAVSENGTLIERGASVYDWGESGNQIQGSGTQGLEAVRFVSCGLDHSGAVTKDGSLYMWGNNSSGKLGDGTTESRYIPVKVLENVRSVSCGSKFTGAVTEDGSLYMWGNNSWGQLGDGTSESRYIPVKVLENVQSVSCGFNHSGAVTKDGSLYMWGNNGAGELGDGTHKNSSIPVKVLENVETISLGHQRSAAVTKDGSLYGWGISGGVWPWSEGGNADRPMKISFSSAAKTSQKITYRSASIKKGKVTYGSSFSLNAKTTGNGKLTYKSSNTKILSVNAKGKVTVKGYGPAYIRIKAAGGSGYKAAVRKIKLTAVPRQGKITKVQWQKSSVRFQWKPEKTADGYEYALAYNKKFSGQSRKKIKKTGLLLTKYKTGTKKMYFKVRTYKKVGKKTYYGSWSKVCLLKLKKAGKSGESSYTIVN